MNVASMTEMATTHGLTGDAACSPAPGLDDGGVENLLAATGIWVPTRVAIARCPLFEATETMV
jgi:hypothetical protein